MREALRWIFTPVIIGLTAACGGDLSAGRSDGGSGQSEGVDAAPVGQASSSSGGSSGGTLVGSGSSGGSPGLPIESSGDDGGCAAGTNILTHESPNPTSEACLACVTKGCQAQLAACANDCACNGAVASAEECVDNEDPSGCFGRLVVDNGSSDETLSATTTCLSMASIECACGETLPDASDPGCTQTGGGGSGGNGECTSNLGETCGGVNYQVVCACPEGSCVCFSQSSSTKVVSFDGCPYCPGGPAGGQSASDLYDLCGFPH